MNYPSFCLPIEVSSLSAS